MKHTIDSQHPAKEATERGVHRPFTHLAQAYSELVMRGRTGRREKGDSNRTWDPLVARPEPCTTCNLLVDWGDEMAPTHIPPTKAAKNKAAKNKASKKEGQPKSAEVGWFCGHVA